MAMYGLDITDRSPSASSGLIVPGEINLKLINPSPKDLYLIR